MTFTARQVQHPAGFPNRYEWNCIGALFRDLREVGVVARHVEVGHADAVKNISRLTVPGVDDNSHLISAFGDVHAGAD